LDILSMNGDHSIENVLVLQGVARLEPLAAEYSKLLQKAESK
jgi:hypothetical protein